MGRKKKTQIEESTQDNQKIEQESKENKFVCCLCGRISFGHGNSPYPIRNTGKCCDECNTIVVLRRLGSAMRKPEADDSIEE